MAHQPTPEIQYIRELHAPQDALLERINTALAATNTPMQIDPEIGRLLQVIIALHHVKTIVEIGTLAGTSAIWMARALPPDGHIYTINKDKHHIDLAHTFFSACEVKHHITMLEGDAHKILPTLTEKAPFDMVFIDADKISYPDYLDWAENNIRRGGLIIADNTLLGGKIVGDEPPANIAPTTWRNMRIFNARLTDRGKYNATIIPTQEGLSIAIKLF